MNGVRNEASKEGALSRGHVVRRVLAHEIWWRRYRSKCVASIAKNETVHSRKAPMYFELNAMLSFRVVMLAISFSFIVLAAPAVARPFTETEATRFLTQSAAYWNASNLAAFMESYADAPTTFSVGSKTVVRGYAAIRNQYARHYAKRGMGRLSFTGLTVRPLGDDYAVIVAHWHLAMRDGSHPTGIFSLVLHRTNGGWRIVVDHST